MIDVTFTCDHSAKVKENGAAPQCQVCGCRRVARVKAPAPRIRGTARGPHCETQNLEPQAVNLAPGGRLPLKDNTDA